MRKEMRPDYEILFNSTVYALKRAYRQYVKAINDFYKYTWIGQDGEYCILEGWEEREKKIKKLGREVIRLQVILKEIKTKLTEE